MTNTMNAFFLHGAKDMRLQQTPVPPLDPDQVLVQIKSTGICGTDIHYYHHGRNGDFVPQQLLQKHSNVGYLSLNQK